MNESRRLPYLDTLCWVAVAVSPTLFVWQGIDVTDFGYQITTFNRVFDHPDTIYYHSFLAWLTNVAGGAVLAVSPLPGALAVKVAYVLCVWATALLVLAQLWAFGAGRPALWATALGVVFANKAPMPWLHYDIVSIVLLCLASWLAVLGLTRDKPWCWFGAGLVLGLNVFVRAPNLAALCLPLGLAVLAGKEGWLRLAADILWRYLAGALTGLALAGGAMVFSGHHHYLLASLDLMAFAARFGTFTHGSQALVVTYGLQVLGAVALGCIVVFLPRLAEARLSDRLVGPLWWAAFALSPLLAYLLCKGYAWMPLYYGVCLVALTKVVLWGGGKPPQRLAAFAALLFMLVQPLGSNTGFFKGYYGLFLALPLTTLALSQGWAGLGQSRRFLAFCLAVTLCIIAAYMVRFTYRDSPSRLAMTHAVDHPELRGLYTTRARAEALQELVDNRAAIMGSYRYLLTEGSVNITYYLFDALPWMYIAWPDAFSGPAFDDVFERAHRERGTLPVLLGSRYEARGETWPAVTPREPYPTERFVAIMERHAYRKAWEGRYFTAWRPENHSPSTD